MSYFFDYVPDQYVGVEKTVSYFEEYSIAYVRVKNFFRTAKIREDMSKYVTLFSPYVIEPGDRPDNVAYKLYRDSRLDWTLCIANNMTDPYQQWPKDYGDELSRFVIEKYGVGNEVAIHHWETREIKDADGTIIQKGGLIVQEDYAPLNYKTKEAIVNPITSITNYEYEELENEKKRFIYVLEPSLIDDFLYEFEEITSYIRNSEQDEYDVPKTYLRPLNRFLVNSSGVGIEPQFGKYKNFIAAAQSTKAFLETEEATTSTTSATYTTNYVVTGSGVTGSFNPTQSQTSGTSSGTTNGSTGTSGTGGTSGGSSGGSTGY